jgi:hypothetical protein
MLYKGFFITEIDENFSSGREQKRDCFEQIQSYLKNSVHESKVCAIYGLRKTGKTTLLRQAAESLSLEERKKALFITCSQDTTDFYDVAAFVEDKIKEGYKYFFIDEITYAENFQRIPTILSDKFVDMHNAKIIITGTDSLGLLLAAQNKMFRRIQFVHTTYTPFAEYSRITGITSLDEFIRLGSTLDINIFDNHDETIGFTNTAIVNNIIHSLKQIEDIESYQNVLTEHYSDATLKNEIERLINRYSQVGIAHAIRKEFHSSSLGDARDFVFQHYENGKDMIAKLDYKKTNESIAKILGCENPSGMQDQDVQLLQKYLFDIGVFSNIPVLNSYSQKEPDRPLQMFTHPGMFHANIVYTLQELLKDSSWIETDDYTKNIIIQKAYESAVGKIMENIIIADLYYSICGKQKVELQDLFQQDTGRWYVSKLAVTIEDRKYESDIIVFDKKKKETYLFEVKHSSETVKEQSTHLESEKFLHYIETNFGPIKGRAVLYNGSLDTKSEIPRIPANEFFVNVYRSAKDPAFEMEDIFRQLVGDRENETIDSEKKTVLSESKEESLFTNHNSLLDKEDDFCL